ncbi:Cinnamyl-alcohol dehydrogenase Flavonol reductase/cinnamoyl-CoA reductase [Coemansia thaxteri]|nr:Cinnamyl-alcohol dehydrogenase Flavonol reductase/cinnamoyl-CoA reductase [Coemansia thaxteri]
MTSKVFVGSIPWGVESSELGDIFGKFGTVVDSKVITDRETGRSRGFGFVTFSSEQEALNAIEGGQDMEIGDRKISVNPANEQGSGSSSARPPRFNSNRSYQGGNGEYDNQGQQQQQQGGEYGSYNNNNRRGGYNSRMGGNSSYGGGYRSQSNSSSGYNNGSYGGGQQRQQQQDYSNAGGDSYHA